MEYVIHLVAGILMAYIGLIPPGMLNMTTMSTTLQKGKNNGMKFAAGAASIVLVHAGVAIIFARYLNEHPSIIESLKYAGIPVFLGLAYFFYTKGRKEFKGKGKEGEGNPFLQGLTMSSFNMLGIPFYLGISTLLQSKGYIRLDAPEMYFVIFGAVLGAFALFKTYSILAEKLIVRISFVAKNINYILSALFLILAVLLIFRTMG